MTLVGIFKEWDWPDLLRQTPGGEGTWDGIKFSLAPTEECDYVIVLNSVNKVTRVKCPPEHVWSIIQEPPTGWAKSWHVNAPHSFRTFTQDVELSGPRYVHSQPALPWHINQDYDFLASFEVPEKDRKLSWITSSLRVLDGHRARMQFLDDIRDRLEFDLIATYEYHLRGKPDTSATREKINEEQSKLGFTCVENKWAGLAPYRYSIAIENFSNPYYWSEKLADCLLAWTMPIYYGCTRIADYFPSEAIIQIDINRPDVVGQIESALADDPWRRNLDAIAEARKLILERYQLFPFLARQIRQFETTFGSRSARQVVTIAPRDQIAEAADSSRRSGSLPARMRQVARRCGFGYIRQLGAMLKNPLG